MRILYIPVFSSSRMVEASPSYNHAPKIIRRIVKKHPDTYFYVLFPKLNEPDDINNFTLRSGKNVFESLPNTKVIYMNSVSHQRTEMFLITREVWELFNEGTGKYYVDLIWNEKPYLAPLLKRLVSNFTAPQSSDVPIVTTTQLIPVAEKGGSLVDLVATSTGYMVSDVPVFQSPHQRNRAIEASKTVLNLSRIEDLRKRAKVITQGVDTEELDKVRETATKYPKLTVNYSSKLYLQKKYEDSFEVMDKAYVSGRQIDVQVVTSSSYQKVMGAEGKYSKVYKYFKVYERANRDTFLKASVKSHIFLMMADYEDFPMTVLEQLYLGLVGILPDTEWAHYVIGKDYPFLYKSKKQALEMLCYLIDNYDKVAPQIITRNIEYIRNTHTMDRMADNFLSEFKRLHKERLENVQPNTELMEIAEKTLKLMNTVFTMEDYVKEFNRHTEHAQIGDYQDNFTLNKFKFYTFCQAKGCKDMCDSEDVKFMKG